jgi:hypothetical protein
VTVPAVEALLFRARGNLRAWRKRVAGALGIAPLPATLGSFGGGGGGVIAAGGAALGSEVALKVAAVVATGAVVGGLGYKTVGAVATPDPGTAAAPQIRHEPRASASPSLEPPSRASVSRGTDAASFHHSRSAVAGRRTVRKAPTGDSISAGGAPSASGSAASEPQGGQSQPPQPGTAVASTVGAVTAPVTSVVSTVALPPATVSTPILTVTVTVPTVTLPPPPPLK